MTDSVHLYTIESGSLFWKIRLTVPVVGGIVGVVANSINPKQDKTMWKLSVGFMFASLAFTVTPSFGYAAAAWMAWALVDYLRGSNDEEE